MPLSRPILAAATAVLVAVFALPALAGDITVKDPYARVSSAISKSGAAFMEIDNSGATPDRLISVTSDAAKVAELHTHVEGANGVMMMRAVPEGFPVAAHGKHMLARGGDHVMLMGLTKPLKEGDVIHITLTFEKAGKITVEVPVDNTREGPIAKMKHGDMSTGN